MITIIKIYFKLISAIMPRLAARQAILLFQTPRKIKFKKAESEFFAHAPSFKVPFYLENISCYQLGNPEGKLVLLIHGWDSNAGSMAGMAYDLVEKGFHVISFNLPAHGYSKLKRTNLKYCKEAFRAVVDYIKPKEPFSVVAHSFGSAVTAFSLSDSNYSTDKLVFLTNPNKLTNIFHEFKSFIGLRDRSYTFLKIEVKKMLGEIIEDISIENYSSRIKYNKLLLVHDYYDKVLPYQNSVNVQSKWKEAEMITFHKIGHYRMLWNKEVIETVSDFLEAKTIKFDTKPISNALVS